MINLFQDIPAETIETTLDMIQRNLDQIGLYGGHTLRKHTDVQVLALKTRLNAEDIIYATSFWDMEVAAAVVKSLMKRYYNPKFPCMEPFPSRWGTDLKEGLMC